MGGYKSCHKDFAGTANPRVLRASLEPKLRFPTLFRPRLIPASSHVSFPSGPLRSPGGLQGPCGLIGKGWEDGRRLQRSQGAGWADTLAVRPLRPPSPGPEAPLAARTKPQPVAGRPPPPPPGVLRDHKEPFLEVPPQQQGHHDTPRILPGRPDVGANSPGPRDGSRPGHRPPRKRVPESPGRGHALPMPPAWGTLPFLCEDMWVLSR